MGEVFGLRPMPRIAKIEPLFDRSRGRWYVYLPAKLSATGKPQREYFPTKEEAETRSKFWHKTQEFSARAVRAAGPELIGTALSFDELFRSVYGLAGGLKEACERYIKLLDSRQHSAPDLPTAGFARDCESIGEKPKLRTP